MTYYNCHTHVFNMHYVPEKFLSVQLPERVADLAHWILNKPWLAKPLMWTMKKILGPRGKKTIAFLTIGLKKTQDMVFAELVGQYPPTDDSRFIVLPLNFQFMGAGKLNIPYRQQLMDLFEVKKKYPDRCYPFVAIDPRMGSGIENRDFAKEFIDKGFSGIKMYPAMGFYPYDLALKDVYQYAEANNIPIMTHCSRGGINYCSHENLQSLENPIDLKGVQRVNEGVGRQKLTVYCDRLNNPAEFELALELFPKLKVCFAHLGMDSTTDFSNPNAPGMIWYNKIMEFMRNKPNVFVDISYTLSNDGFYKWFIPTFNALSADIQKRVLFGTDFFMTVQEAHGDDNELFAEMMKEVPAPIFNQLAIDNMLRYLNSSVHQYAAP